MIRVSRGAAPPFVSDPEFLNARKQFEQFGSEGGTRTTQATLNVSSALGSFQRQAAAYVGELFLGKCAYSEVITSGLLHLHRPEADAAGDDGVSAPHYWWTALWYGNWYAASQEVAGQKRNNFPVIGGRAEPPGLGDTGLVLEPGDHLDDGVILDPCRDDPQLHLEFLPGGAVQPWSPDRAPWLGDDALRGMRTIELCGLNSSELIRARQNAITTAISRLDREGSLSDDLIDPRLPHVGAIRQVLAARLLRDDMQELTPDLRRLAPELVPLLASHQGRYSHTLARGVLESLQEADEQLIDVLQHALGGYGVPIEPPPETVLPQSTFVIPRTASITHVFVRNFQAIKTLNLDFSTTNPTPEPEPSSVSSSSPDDDVSASTQARRPWRVLLGENGAGKSSVLKAIGLALATTSLSDLVERCDIRWADLLRRDEIDGEVVVTFSNTESIRLHFDATRGWFEEPSPRLDAFVRGFGATRLFENEGALETGEVRLDNLYQPRIPVMDAEKWLLAVPDDEDFNAAAATILRLLDRVEKTSETAHPTEQKLVRRTATEVTVDGDPLRTLSDGYRSVIAMACDLMAGSGTGYSDARNIPGFVLLDELGSHLHPRWRMRITDTLRNEFSSMQFIVSTHEPLCLRGLVEGEVIGVTRSEATPDQRWKAEFEPIAQSPSGLRVDQLLTSEFFGLGTTIDPKVEELFQRYYALVRKADPTPGEQAERDNLKARLSRYGVLGYTARDQLIYDAIDEFLAGKNTQDDKQADKTQSRAARRADTVTRVANVWRAAAARHDPDATP